MRGQGWGQGQGQGCKIIPQTAIPVSRRWALEMPGGWHMPALLPVLRWHNPGIFLLSKGVFSAPCRVQKLWWGWLYPEAGGPCPAFAAVSLGISPLLKNEHLIKKKKTQKRKKKQIKIPTKGPDPRECHWEHWDCCQVGRIPHGSVVGGLIKQGGGQRPPPSLTLPRHCPAAPQAPRIPVWPPLSAHPPPSCPPRELKGDLCLLLALCFTVLEKGHKRDPNRVVFFKNFSIFSDVSPPPHPGSPPQLPARGCQGSSPSPEGSSLLWSMESLSLPSVSEAVSEAEGSGQARAGVTMTARLCSSSCSCFSCVPSMCWIACRGQPTAVRTSCPPL